MGISLIIFISQLWADPDLYKMEEGFDATAPAEEDVFVGNESCGGLLCQFKLPNNTKKLDQICGKDPFKVVNENTQEDFKKYDEEEKRVNQVLQEAENRALLAMGYTSLDEYLAHEVQKKGLSLNTKALDFRSMKKGEMSYFGSFFNKGEKCQTMVDGFEVEPDDEKSESDDLESETPADTQRYLSRINADMRKLAAQIEPYREYSQNLDSLDPQTLYDDLVNQCAERSKGERRPLIIANNRRAVQVFHDRCKNIESLRGEAEELFRIKNIAPRRYRAQAKEFAKNFSYRHDLAEEFSIVPGSVGLPVLLQNRVGLFENLKARAESICSSISENEASIGYDVVSDAMTKVHRNKVFVDHFFDTLYPQERLDQYTRVIEATRAGVTESISAFYSNENSRGARELVNEPKPHLPVKPPESNYVKDFNGQYYLKPELKNSYKIGDDIAWQLSNDPHLWGFRDMNGYYMAQVGKDPSVVAPEGMYFHLLSMNPYMSVQLFGHEFGHAVDPNMGPMNGLRASKKVRDSMRCYRESFGMELRQAGETMSDAMAAELLAKELKFIDPKNRANVVIEYLKSSCIYSRHNHPGSLEIEARYAHPPSHLRVNAVFFAHPKIRKMLGCTPKQNRDYPYKACPPHDYPSGR